MRPVTLRLATAAIALAAVLSAQPGEGLRADSAPATASTIAQASAPTATPALLQVVYFHSPTCLQCREAEHTVNAAERKFAGRVRVVRYSIAEEAGLEALLAYEAKYGSPKGTAPPKVYVGRKYLGGLDSIQQRLEQVIAEELTHLEEQPTAHAAATEPPPLPRESIEQRFSSFTLSAILLAGLLDGVNPCAFTTIVFLLSILAHLHRTRRDLAVVSVMFTAGVFLTYLLLGAGIFWTIKAFAVSRGISQGLTYVMVGLAFVLAGWSLFDAVRIARTGRVPRASLGMPTSVKQRVHQVIRTGVKMRNLALGAFSVGILVSLLESVCTGQVYLPTIVLILRTSPRRWTAATYLVLYNLMFIVPLVVLTAISYWGVGSQRLGDFFRRHLVLAKVLMALLFGMLGALLLRTS